MFEDSRMISGETSLFISFVTALTAWFLGREVWVLELDFLVRFEVLEGLRETLFEKSLGPIKHEMLSFDMSNLILESPEHSPILRTEAEKS